MSKRKTKPGLMGFLGGGIYAGYKYFTSSDKPASTVLRKSGKTVSPVNGGRNSALPVKKEASKTDTTQKVAAGTAAAAAGTITAGTVAAVSLGVLVGVLVIGGVCYYYHNKQKTKKRLKNQRATDQYASATVAQPLSRLPIAEKHLYNRDTHNSVESRTELVGVEPTRSVTCSRTKKKTCVCVPVTLSVFYVNIQSLNPSQRNQQKLNKLKYYIATSQPDIIALVETWLDCRTDLTEPNLADKLGLENYTLYQYNRDNSSDLEEMSRKGGGFLVAVKTTLLTLKGFTFKHTNWKGNTFSQFFTLARTFNCGVCPRTGVNGCRKGTKSYGFVLHYKRPQPFARNKSSPAEERKGFMKKVSTAFNQLAGSTDTAMSGGVIVGDFNLSESKGEWEAYIKELCLNSGRIWARIPLWPGESTTARNSPDGILAFPAKIVQDLRLISVGTVHKGINFQLFFGKDFNKACEKCE